MGETALLVACEQALFAAVLTTTANPVIMGLLLTCEGEATTARQMLV